MDDPARRVLLAIAAQQSGEASGVVDTLASPSHLKHYRAVLKQQRCGSKHLVPNSHVGLIEYKEVIHLLFPRRLLAFPPLSGFSFFPLSGFLIFVDQPELFC